MTNFINISDSQKDEYNKVVKHPLQSYEWGQFRQKTGVKVIRQGLVKNGKIANGFTLTIHKVPFTKYNIGYLPKGDLPTKEILDELYKIGKSENCAYIQLEPNFPIVFTSEVAEWTPRRWTDLGLRPSFHPLFTKYTFVLDLTKSEDELLKAMHPKTRYNIKVAQKHGVRIEEDNSQNSFDDYLRLTFETTNRQKFYAHTEKYHRLMWNTLKVKNSNIKYRNLKQIQNTNIKGSKHLNNLDLENSDIVSDFGRKVPLGQRPLSGFRASDLDHLSAHLFSARYKPDDEKEIVLVSWILFTFHDTLYYPYGASSDKHRNTMASNLIMWEAIKFGKKLGLKKFDMWGALGPNPDSNDPWYGFHRFKEGYGATLTEFAGSYDLVINPLLYQILKAADYARWIYLRLKK